ncbi:DEAD/DEAH box helicase [Pseudomonadota bacterium]
MSLKLRQWQDEALKKAIDWLLVKRTDKRFLINAAPGAGKTLASCAIAQKLFQNNEINRVVVIAPRTEVVNQWADDFRWVTGRHMSKVTAADGEISALDIDVCATWSAIQSLLPEFQALCQASRVLVICDEHHHAAVEATWGNGADNAFADARFALVLTGTPIRSDGAESVWLAYDDAGAIDHPDEGTYTLTYGDAVDLGYCRPVTFHRHEGKFTVDLDQGVTVNVSGHSPVELPPALKRVHGLQTTLDFYKLARTPQYAKDKVTPVITGYQATMLEWGSEKLTELRHRMPSAGGLVIAPSIEMAEYMVQLLEMIEGERPMLVHSQMPRPNSKIKAFRNTNKRWLVSVAMVSEGVDIKRLRVLVHLPNALTELAFRQAIGRVVRTAGPHDDTRAYVVMPSFETFENYARRIEEEMSPGARVGKAQPRTKRCASCEAECELSARECPHCGFEFPVQPERVKTCDSCGAINPISMRDCHACGKSFSHDFTLTLDEALRTGAIVRGMDIDEIEVQQAEQIAPRVRREILRSGDQRLVKIVQTLPDESWARLQSILNAS